MEPRHLACRAGLFAYVFCFLVIAPPTLSAQTLGSPAKVMRSSAPAVEREVRATTEINAEAEPDALPAVSHRAGVQLPYLPMTGALPLRFVATRDWPASQSSRTPPSQSPSEPQVAASSTQTVAPALPVPGSDTILPETSVAGELAIPPVSPAITPKSSAPEPTVLTADMVLGFLGDLPPAEARVSVRFEPALPVEARRAAGNAYSP